ncbi:hypothetical protein ACEPPN_019524 [Leptodophora sp. 'Broadleaf-Isolate-01']
MISKFHTTLTHNNGQENTSDSIGASTVLSSPSSISTLQPIGPIKNPKFGIEHILAIVFGVVGLTTALYGIWQNRRRGIAVANEGLEMGV